MHNEGRKHWGLLCTMEGTETYHFRDRDVAAQPGTVLVIPKNEVYTIDLEGSRSVVYVIDFELITPENMRPLLVHLPEKSTIPAQFSEAERCWRSKKSGFTPDCMAYYYKIIAELLRLDQQSSIRSTTGKFILQWNIFMSITPSRASGWHSFLKLPG